METDENDLNRLVRVCAAYGLGELRTARYISVGLVNRNWRVDTTAGVYAVKELRDRLATGVREQHRRVRLLIGWGVPIPEPLERDGGDPVCTVNGAEFTVSAWAPGEHLDGIAMSVGQATALGEMLGGIHVALADVLGPGVGGPGIAIPDPGRALTYLDHLLGIIEQRPEKDEIDEVALANLAFKRKILTGPALSAPATRELGPQGYIHGDFHHNNVLWDDGRISAVVDWDRIRVQSLASELIRTCLLAFGGDRGIDLPRAAAFACGYRLRRPLTDSDLIDAEERMWWLWLNGFWPLDEHYEDGITTFDRLFVHSASTFRWWTGNRAEFVSALTRCSLRASNAKCTREPGGVLRSAAPTGRAVGYLPTGRGGLPGSRSTVGSCRPRQRPRNPPGGIPAACPHGRSWQRSGCCCRSFWPG